jgi:hypothetical protein
MADMARPSQPLSGISDNVCAFDVEQPSARELLCQEAERLL